MAKDTQKFVCEKDNIEFGSESAYKEHLKTHSQSETVGNAQATVTPPQTPAPASTEVDPILEAKRKELDDAIARANAAAEKLEKQASAQSGEFRNPNMASPTEIQSVDQVRTGKIARMKEVLKNQPTTRIFVPLEGREKPGTLLPVTINGYRVNVPKGVYCDVPEQVGQIIMDSMNQTEEAISRNPKRIDLESEKANVLS